MYNNWRHHNLGCSKAGNSELETVIRNKFKHSRYNASSGYLQVLKRFEQKCGGNLVKLYFSDAEGQITLQSVMILDKNSNAQGQLTQ